MEKELIGIVGGGLVGSLWSSFLASRGYRVEVVESRPDLLKKQEEGGRSINLALSDRGWKALDKVGMKEPIEDLAIPMKGRMIHDPKGELTFQPYGKEGQAIHSVSRSGLNKALLQQVQEYEGIELTFDQKCHEIDPEQGVGIFEDRTSGKKMHRTYDRIFGTDGAFSAVRARLQKTIRFNYSQEFLEHGYKELSIPPAADGSHRMEKNALHIWPRHTFMMIALPNPDGSFTCTLFLPFKGEKGFEAIQTEQDLHTFFEREFPDALPLLPTLSEDFFSNPTGSLVTIRCEPWNYKDKVLLLGDAAHAIVPFYGQGMNAGFEDCRLLDEMMDHFESWEAMFDHFSTSRKPDADAIADLALHNFIEMRDKTADPSFLLQKRIEKKLSEKHPDKWTPLYAQVTFSHTPYSKALDNGKEQEAIMKEVMAMEDIEQKWDSQEVEEFILRKLDS